MTGYVLFPRQRPSSDFVLCYLPGRPTMAAIAKACDANEYCLAWTCDGWLYLASSTDLAPSYDPDAPTAQIPVDPMNWEWQPYSPTCAITNSRPNSMSTGRLAMMLGKASAGGSSGPNRGWADDWTDGGSGSGTTTVVLASTTRGSATTTIPLLPQQKPDLQCPTGTIAGGTPGTPSGRGAPNFACSGTYVAKQASEGEDASWGVQVRMGGGGQHCLGMHGGSPLCVPLCTGVHGISARCCMGP